MGTGGVLTKLGEGHITIGKNFMGNEGGLTMEEINLLTSEGTKCDGINLPRVYVWRYFLNIKI